MRRAGELKIGDLERQTGVSRSSIAHYVQLGLLPPPRKLGPKLFLFNEAHVEALQRIRRLREQEQLPLAEIRARMHASSTSRGALARRSAPAPEAVIEPRRRAILECATRLFARDGFDAVRLSDVARELGLSKAALYQSFESKEALFVECIDHIRFLVVPRELRAARKREPDPLRRAYLRSHAVLAKIDSYRMLTHLLSGVAHGRNRVLAKRAQDAFHRMVTDVLPELHEAKRTGLVRDLNLDLTAYVLWGALMGTGEYMFYAGDASPETLADAYVQLMASGMLAQPTPRPHAASADMKSLVAAFAIGCTLVAAPEARACSPNPCPSPSVFPSGGEIPAEQFRLRFRPGVDLRLGPVSSQALEPARLFDVTDGVRTAVTPVITDDGYVDVLSLADAPAPGTRFVLESAAPSSCTDAGAKPLTAEFTITASAPMPVALGQLTAAVEIGMVTVPTRAGSCSVNIEAAYGDLALALDATALPFVNVIEYQFLLDGVPSAPPRGEERVYAPCGSAADVIGASSLGVHRARFRGTLPNGVMVESDEVEFELSCGSTAPTDAGAASDAQEAPLTAAGIADQGGCNVTRRLGSGAPSAWLSMIAAWAFSLVLRTRRMRAR